MYGILDIGQENSNLLTKDLNVIPIVSIWKSVREQIQNVCRAKDGPRD